MPPSCFSAKAAQGKRCWPAPLDRKSTRLNSSHTVIYTLSLHDALPIFMQKVLDVASKVAVSHASILFLGESGTGKTMLARAIRSEEHTSELQSHRDLHSFPTRRSSDLHAEGVGCRVESRGEPCLHPVSRRKRHRENDVGPRH